MVKKSKARHTTTTTTTTTTTSISTTTAASVGALTRVNEGVSDESKDLFFVLFDVVRPSDFLAAQRRDKRRGDPLLRQETVHLILQCLHVTLDLQKNMVSGCYVSSPANVSMC